MLSPFNIVNPHNRVGPMDFDSTRALMHGKPDRTQHGSDPLNRDKAWQPHRVSGWKSMAAASVAGLLVLAVVLGGNLI